MDIGTILGTLLGLVLTGVTMWMSSGGQLIMFVDVASAVMVIGGAICASMVALPLSVVIGGAKVTMKTLFANVADPRDIIDAIVEASETARKGSVLALEKVEIEDEFLAKMVRYLVDGYSPEAINQLIDLEIFTVTDRHTNGKRVYDGLGEFAPAFGMIGTLIGLVNMLANMSDPKSIGPAMAVAILTTLYGAIIANLIAVPLKDKLAMYSSQEIDQKTLMLEGILGLKRGENPRMLEEALHTFLTPAEREALKAGG